MNDDINLKSGEIDVVNLLMKGLTTQQIADKLNMSLHCIKYRKKMLFYKFDVYSSAELIIKYAEHRKKRAENE